mmetsp:Transcript_19465/g.50223  ORF Transcript_19465/g.50223 Transcript_19465/m.50223 type:complete len:182 (+) Transcript_19465:88-633(+)
MRKTILKGPSEKPPRKKHASLEWDESNLGDNAEYLASTTRTKIVEPKTPYQPPLNMDAIDDDGETNARRLKPRHSFELRDTAEDEREERIVGELADLDAMTGAALARREDAPPAEAAPGAATRQSDGVGNSAGGSNGDTPPTKHDKDAFSARRAAHYDEFKKMQELKAKGALDVDDEDDES